MTWALSHFSVSCPSLDQLDCIIRPPNSCLRVLQLFTYVSRFTIKGRTHSYNNKTLLLSISDKPFDEEARSAMTYLK